MDFASSAPTAGSSLPAGQWMPRPPPGPSYFGMMWKWTWKTAWWAAAPLFCRMLKSVHPVAAFTARQILGRARPTAAAASSPSWSSVAAGSLGITSVCPRLRGKMSRKAKTAPSS